MNHLEALVAEYLMWQGFLIRHNVKVSRLNHGGWAAELDVVGFHPGDGRLIHYEPSLDSNLWKKVCG